MNEIINHVDEKIEIIIWLKIEKDLLTFGASKVLIYLHQESSRKMEANDLWILQLHKNAISNST